VVKTFKTRVARIAELLNRYGVHYVVGGEACNVHGVVRGTKDVDILLEKSKANVERALSALQELPYRIAAELDAEEVLSKPITIVGDDPRVDLLFAAGKISYKDALADVYSLEIEGVLIPFAGLDSLMRSKKTDRTKDKADMEVLEQIKKKTS
jgi:hypothetical protein